MPDSITRKPGTMRPDQCKHQMFIKFQNSFSCSINSRTALLFFFPYPQGGRIPQNKNHRLLLDCDWLIQHHKNWQSDWKWRHIGVTVPHKCHRRATVTPACWFIIRPISSLPATTQTEARISLLWRKGRANFGYWKSLAAYDPDIKRWWAEGGVTHAGTDGDDGRTGEKTEDSKTAQSVL